MRPTGGDNIRLAVEDMNFDKQLRYRLLIRRKRKYRPLKYRWSRKKHKPVRYGYDYPVGLEDVSH